MAYNSSNSGSAEARHYADVDRDQAEALRREKASEACDKILDAFDGKDVMTAFDVVSTLEPERMHDLYEALSALAQVQVWKIEDARLRNIAKAFQRVSDYYAGYVVGSEEYK